jgi:hypothetical protein
LKLNNDFQTINGNQSSFIFDSNKISFLADSITLASSADVSMPYIINSAGIDFTFLTKLTVSSTNVSSGSFIKLQISNDNENWYFYDTLSTTWINSVFTTTLSGSNLPSEITSSSLDKFVYQIDSGKFYFKMFFISDGVSTPSNVSNINVQGDKYYTSIKQVRSLLQPYGLRMVDPVTGQYCEAEDFLSDTKLKAYVPLADAYINNSTFTDFYYHKDSIEFYDGNGKDSLRTYNFPITKITHVIMYNPLLQAMRTFLDFELIIHPEWGEVFLPPIYPAYMADAPARAMFGNIFITGRRNIEVKYDWGYDATPEDINLAATKYVGIQVLSGFWAYLTRGVQSRSFDGYSESYGQKPFAGIIEMWEKEIKGVINTKIKLFQRSI